MTLRPTKVATLGSLLDHLKVMSKTLPRDTELFIETDEDLALGATVVCYGDDDEYHPFITIESWTDSQLAANAANCDRLGIK